MEKFHYSSLDSTQSQARRLIDGNQNFKSGFVIADEQTQGRGQYGKSWASPKGAGIYLSIINRQFSSLRGGAERKPVQSVAWDGNPELLQDQELIKDLTQGASEKLIATLNEFYLSDYYIKPINDVYHAGSKLAGILVEIYKGYIIIGIGINVLNVKRSLKESIIEAPKAPPISLEEILPAEIFAKFDKEIFVNSLVENFLNPSLT